jgi:glutamate-ammonia-ligase adenylyltransferase
VRDRERVRRDLTQVIARAGDTVVAESLWRLVATALPDCPDPSMAARNFERFAVACADPSDMLRRLVAAPGAVDVLLQIFSASQYFSDMLTRDPELFEWLRTGGGKPLREELVQALRAERAEAGCDAQTTQLAVRRFRHREMLRIGYQDIVRGAPLEQVTLSLSGLAESCIEIALESALEDAEKRHGPPVEDSGLPARIAVLALGKLGGEELNYSSDIDLLFIYSAEGKTAGERSVSNAEYFARVAADVVRLLSDHSALGSAYRVDIRLRPEGGQGALARSLAATLGYYETAGKTWERQALVKCRPVGGDPALGRRFVEAITPFVYRQYLGASEISEIKAMKRRIENRTRQAGDEEVEVKTGRGGIRDVEFVVQFLQLLHGGADPTMRHHNTLEALARLERAGCLTVEERSVLDETYRFLRRIEHRLQTMFDTQTHQMPREAEEVRRLAMRMGFMAESAWEDRTGPAERFLREYRAKTDRNRLILNHLLHDAFKGDAAVDPVVDLVLDPEPSSRQVNEVLGRYAFQDSRRAFRNLQSLATEDYGFLSQARCRHFLAAIAPELLRAVVGMPNPDQTLVNLEKVSASLGAKAMLWELFSFNPPSLRLYVELCATSQFLSEIIINNPGMIDDLMDSLVVDRPRTIEEIEDELRGLCRGAEDLGPILLGFRNTEWVRIGTRDILRREPVREVTRELSDVAESIVRQAAWDAWHTRSVRYGTPRRASDGSEARWAIVGLGKLGGREMSYHSDLDLVFVYDEPGRCDGASEASVSNERFFEDWARTVIRTLSGADVPLYRVDARLRPEGASGSLAVSLERLRQYLNHRASTWERLALCRARVLAASEGFELTVSSSLMELLARPVDEAELAREVVELRRRVAGGHSSADIKRSPGGQMTIEFILHFLQLVFAPTRPSVLVTNTWEVLAALHDCGTLDADARKELEQAHEFTRTIEGRFRLANNRANVELPTSLEAAAKLTRALGGHRADPEEAARSLWASSRLHAERVDRLFDRLVAARVRSRSN